MLSETCILFAMSTPFLFLLHLQLHRTRVSCHITWAHAVCASAEERVVASLELMLCVHRQKSRLSHHLSSCCVRICTRASCHISGAHAVCAGAHAGFRPGGEHVHHTPEHLSQQGAPHLSLLYILITCIPLDGQNFPLRMHTQAGYGLAHFSDDIMHPRTCPEYRTTKQPHEFNQASCLIRLAMTAPDFLMHVPVCVRSPDSVQEKKQSLTHMHFLLQVIREAESWVALPCELLLCSRIDGRSSLAGC